MILTILILLCCLCAGCLLWKKCCADIPAYIKHKVNRVTRGSYFQDYADPPGKREVSETHSDEEDWDNRYPQQVGEDNGSSSEDMSDIDIKEEMLLDTKPYVSPTPQGKRNIDESMMLANEPHNQSTEDQEGETINGNLLLTSEPHQDDDADADDEAEGAIVVRPSSTRSAASSKRSSKRASTGSKKPSSKRSSTGSVPSKKPASKRSSRQRKSVK